MMRSVALLARPVKWPLPDWLFASRGRCPRIATIGPCHRHMVSLFGGSMTANVALTGNEVRRPSELRRGFVAMLPLWAGVVPFALAFALLARTAGFSALETQALSALVFAGGAQVAVVTLYAGGAGAVAIVLTVLVLNLRHILYGLSLGQQLGKRTRPPLPLLAFLLTDEAYGVTVKDGLDGRGGPRFFLGASLSLYGAF